MAILSDDRWRALSPLLDEALDLFPPERNAWLAALDERDPAIAADVRALLKDHDALDARGFLEAGAGLLAGGVAYPIPTTLPANRELPGATVGAYRLVSELGAGGMGVVWLAQQEQPIRRQVAVKVVRPGADSREVLSRFEAERQALAILNHPGIAKVLDAGATSDGRPYFVMEHIAGSSLTEFADQHQLTIAQRLRLFLQVCDAVQHAHQKGVLHRDLKPRNILVGDEDGRYAVKVIDFGIAKALGQHFTGKTLQTELGVVVGTPEYMSPEQAGLLDEAVDTRTDIYSLGLILYELLAGAPPFDHRDLRRRTVLEALRVIREEEPPRLTTRLTNESKTLEQEVARNRGTDPRTLRRQLRGDLEWITARAIEKEPGRRYASVSELRADVERHLQGEPVLAGAPSTMYRLRKLARRHRVVAASLVIVAAAITVSAVVSALALVRALRAEDLTRRQLIGSLVTQGMRKVDEADPLIGLVHLVRALELETDPERIRNHRIRIGEILQRSPRLVRVWRHQAAITMLDLSSQGLVATGSTDGSVSIRDLRTGEKRGRDIPQGAAIVDGQFSPDGAILAVASVNGQVRLWTTADGSLAREFRHDQGIVDVEFSPDGAFIAAISVDGVVNVWNARDGAHAFTHAHQGAGSRVAFSTAGNVLGSGATDGVRLWHMPRGEAVLTMPVHAVRGGALDLAFSSDDRWLATAGADDSARLWDVRTGQALGTPMLHDGSVTSVQFADASRALVTTSDDGTTRTWTIPEGAPKGEPRISGSVANLAVVSRNLVIATSAQSGLVDLWSFSRGERSAPSLSHGGLVDLRFDETGRFLVTAGAEGLARIWDLAPALSAPPRILADEVDFHWRVAASPDAAVVGVSSGNAPERGAVRVFEIGTGAPVTPAMRFRSLNTALGFSSDGRRLVTASSGGEARVWDVATGEPLTPVVREETPLQFAAFSQGDETFVVAGYEGKLNDGQSQAWHARVRAAHDGAARSSPLRHDGGIYDVSISPDGRRLLTVSDNAGVNVKVWEVATGRLLWSATHGDGAVVGRWSPDASRVYTGGIDQRVRAWNSSSGAPEPVAVRMQGGVSALAVTHDGMRLLIGSDGGDVRLVSVTRDAKAISVMSHKGYVYHSHFNRDGSLALTSAGDSTARLWDAKTGEPLTPSLQANSLSRGAAFLASGRSWAWTGSGVWVDELNEEKGSIEALRASAESAAGRTLSASGAEIALSAEEIEARFAKSHTKAQQMLPPGYADFDRATAAAAWGQGRYDDVVASLEPLRAQGALRWPDVMRLTGAYAATSRWREALDELRRHRARWNAAPELLYMEAVALSALDDAAGGERHCRAALDATRGTRHPERALWAARGCLVQAVARDSRDQVAQRVELALPHVSGERPRSELLALLLLRTEQADEALTTLRSAPSRVPPGKGSLILMAAAAAHAGARSDARRLLREADATKEARFPVQLAPWFEAEASSLLREVSRKVATPAHRP
jgi:WD40 repeat protein/serine/threonine protein kinase